MDDANFAPLDAAEGRHFWFRARRRMIETLVRQLVPTLPTPVRVIEIGCGNGFVTDALVSIFGKDAVTAVEPAGEGLRIARQRLSCRVLEGDITSTVGTGPYSLVAMFDVLEHIEDERGALAIARELLAPGGVLLLTVPAHESLWSYWDEVAGHFRRYEREGLTRTLEEAGFEVEYASGFFRLLYPMMRVSRAVANLRGRRESAEERQQRAVGELRVVPVANAILTWTLGREAARVGKRRSHKHGTSMVAVARR